MTFIALVDGEPHVSYNQTPEQWDAIKSGALGEILCAGCNEPLIPKAGSDYHVRPHFAHHAEKSACGGAGETDYHKLAKAEIVRIAQASGCDVFLEKREGNFQPDVRIVRPNGTQLGFEFQHSPQSAQNYLERTAKYEDSNLPVVWITWQKYWGSLSHLHAKCNIIFISDDISDTDVPPMAYFLETGFSKMGGCVGLYAPRPDSFLNLKSIRPETYKHFWREKLTVERIPILRGITPRQPNLLFDCEVFVRPKSKIVLKARCDGKFEKTIRKLCKGKSVMSKTWAEAMGFASWLFDTREAQYERKVELEYRIAHFDKVTEQHEDAEEWQLIRRQSIENQIVDNIDALSSADNASRLRAAEIQFYFDLRAQARQGWEDLLSLAQILDGHYKAFNERSYEQAKFQDVVSKATILEFIDTEYGRASFDDFTFTHWKRFVDEIDNPVMMLYKLMLMRGFPPQRHFVEACIRARIEHIPIHSHVKWAYSTTCGVSDEHAWHALFVGGCHIWDEDCLPIGGDEITDIYYPDGALESISNLKTFEEPRFSDEGFCLKVEDGDCHIDERGLVIAEVRHATRIAFKDFPHIIRYHLNYQKSAAEVMSHARHFKSICADMRRVDDDGDETIEDKIFGVYPVIAS